MRNKHKQLVVTEMYFLLPDKFEEFGVVVRAVGKGNVHRISHGRRLPHCLGILLHNAGGGGGR